MLSALAAAAGLVWCLSIGLLIWPVPAGHSVMRIAVSVVAVAVTVVTIRHAKRRCLLSPPYLLGMVVLLFYGLAPVGYLQVFPDPPAYFVRHGTAGHVWTESFVGSRGELLVLQFAALCFTVAAVVLRLVPLSRALLVPAGAFRTLGTVWAPALAMLIGVLYVLGRESETLSSFLARGAGAQLKHAMAPILSFCLATIAYVAGRGAPRRVLSGIAVILASLLGMVAGSGLAFTSVYMAASVILLIIVVREQRAVELTITALAIAGVVIATIPLNALARGDYRQDPGGMARYAQAALISKLNHRQGVSGHCLDRILHRHVGVEEESPLYFLYAVVPRAVWPDKPILSRGNEFAVSYCGQGSNVNPNHSESITLLGEPILKAGMAGLIVAELFLAILLGTVAFFGLSGGAVPLIAMTAMLPWLATFQQHFAQYFGNVVKMFLIMLPFVIVLSWASRGAASRGAVGPA